MMPTRLAVIAIALFLASGPACARQPSPSHATKVIHRYFVTYAKRYPTSPFGQSPVANVTIEGMEEIHKRFVATTATVTFHDGRAEAVRCSIEHRMPRGWKIISWERLTAGR